MSKEIDLKNLLESLEDRVHMLEKNLSSVVNKLEEHLKWGRPTTIPDYKPFDKIPEPTAEEEAKSIKMTEEDEDFFNRIFSNIK